MNVNNGKIIWTYEIDYTNDIEDSVGMIDDDDEEAVYPINQYKLGDDDHLNNDVQNNNNKRKRQ